MQLTPFLARALEKIPTPSSSFQLEAWRLPGRPTSEAVGVVGGSIDVDAMVARIVDVDAYRGNVDHVLESRSMPDPALSPPASLRFYQRLDIPLLAKAQFVNVMRDYGEIDGWRIVGWELVEDATAALHKRDGARFDYNDGGWFLRPDGVGYALSSAPRKSDLGLLKYTMMTKGSDAAASAVLQANIKGMIAWSRR